LFPGMITALSGFTDSQCRGDFGGTSSATPTSAGAVALILSANPALTWRDVQHIIVNTADRNDPTDPTWLPNAVGVYHSINHGFGRLNCTAAVRAAQNWDLTSTGSLTVHTGPFVSPQAAIPGTGTVQSTYTVLGNTSEPSFTEHALVHLTLSHNYIGRLTIQLVSPAGTVAKLAPAATVNPATSLNNYELSARTFWGEPSLGMWTLTITGTQSGDSGTFQSWNLVLSGQGIQQPGAGAMNAPGLMSFFLVAIAAASLSRM